MKTRKKFKRKERGKSKRGWWWCGLCVEKKRKSFIAVHFTAGNVAP